jgi:hypothetical protein
LTTIDEVLEFPPTIDLLDDPDVWIADSGCSIHCTGYQHGMTNVIMHGHSGGEDYVQPDGSVSKTISTGDIPVTLHDKYGQEVGDCRLTGVNYVKGQRFNLFSTTKLQIDGWVPRGNTKALWFTHSGTNFVMMFDIKIETGRGCVFAAHLRRREDTTEVLAMTNIKMDVLQVHHRLGHPNEDLTRKSAQILGWQITQGSWTNAKHVQ